MADHPFPCGPGAGAGAGAGAGQAAALAFLGDPATHGGAAVERIDTHAAVVFLAGDRAWKVKRAVRLPYLDFSTRERRRAVLETELRLNRRTAPSLYIGVWAVDRRRDGGLALVPAEAAGPEAEPVLLMRRFPADAALDRMAATGGLTPELVRRLGDRVADLHALAPRRPDGDGDAGLAAVAAGNAEELRGRPDLFSPPLVERLVTDTGAALRRLAPLLDARRRAGRVRLCHGDLHLGNIVLLDGDPTPFDGIEFDEGLATIDVLYDLAFLVMDLERRGLNGAAHGVLDRWLERTGDWGGLAALPLFLSLRAAVRAKIAATAGQATAAVAHLDFAVRALRPAAPRLVAVGGLSGTGKSTLARGLAPGLGAMPGAVILRSDVVRKLRFGCRPEDPLPADAYTPAVTADVYARLARWADTLLAAGRTVVVDAVYARAGERAAIAGVAATQGVRFTGLWLEAPAAVRAGRVSARAPDASDADARVVAAQEGYAVGAVAWHRVAAGSHAVEVLARAREFLA